MKKMFGLLAVIAVIASCDKSQNKYVIHGTVPAEVTDGMKVYLTDYETKGAVDSATVTDGAFTFSGNVENDVIRRIDCGRAYANIILEKGDIKVDLSDPANISGTPSNDALKKFLEESNSLLNTVREEVAKIQGDEALETEAKQQQLESLGKDYEQKIRAIADPVLKANPDNALGAYIFWRMLGELSEPEKEYKELAKSVGENVLNFGPVKKSIESYENVAKTAEGNMFTDFTIENGSGDGKPVKLSDYVGKGKYVLVDFWASWCGPCRRETPVLAEVYNKYKGDKFELLGVAVWDQLDKTKEAVAELNMTWPQILDAQEIPTDLYGIQGIPHIILFAPDGTIVARNLRGEALKKKVAEVMGSNT